MPRARNCRHQEQELFLSTSFIITNASQIGIWGSLREEYRQRYAALLGGFCLVYPVRKVDGTTLYAYTFGQSCTLGIQTSTISLSFQGHDHVVVFKSIPANLNMKDKLDPLQIKWVGNGAYNIDENSAHHGYLLEMSNGKLLIVLKVIDIMINNVLQDHDHENNNNNNNNDEPPRMVCQYFMTKGFKVFSFDPQNGEVCQLSKLEEPDDVIFVGSGCFSLSSKNFDNGFIQGNRIYFFDDVSGFRAFELEAYSYASRETGVFDLHTGKINRFIPSVLLPMLSQMLWFTPTLM